MPIATVADPDGLIDLLVGDVAPDEARPFVERSEPRIDSNWIAVIVPAHGKEIPCSVRDVSKSGVRVGVPETMPLPETFVLKVLGKDVSCHVRVMWRRSNQAGLRIERMSRTSLDAAKAPPAPPVPARRAQSPGRAGAEPHAGLGTRPSLAAPRRRGSR